MNDYEISLARAYLEASGNDVVAALIRSVRDLAALRDQAGCRPTRSSASIRLVASGERHASRAA